jgi:ABC-type bacteriocin/lantibiotic exporter with double-glycine peptidase domain
MRKFGTPRFLPDKPFVRSLVIPAGSFLAGLIVYQIVRPVGLYICIAAVFQRWTYSRLYKAAKPERQIPPVIVEVAKGTPSLHSGAEESAFKERWRGVLNRPPPPLGQS